MSAPRYLWRQLNEKQRAELLAWRRTRGYPWHSPPHRPNFGHLRFLISASCFEHRHYIGYSRERMDNFSRDLLAVFATHTGQTFAWCVLPNHYHALVETPDIKALLRELGCCMDARRMLGTARSRRAGEKFCSVPSRAMRSDRHYWATLNYVHHNPVRHGYVARWTGWPWSSATEYLAQTGVEEAKRIWQEYPLHDYGKDWDEPGM
jgi:putative transposase